MLNFRALHLWCCKRSGNPKIDLKINVQGISEVPSEARNLDEALAKSDMNLLGDVYDADNSEHITFSYNSYQHLLHVEPNHHYFYLWVLYIEYVLLNLGILYRYVLLV